MVAYLDLDPERVDTDVCYTHLPPEMARGWCVVFQKSFRVMANLGFLVCRM